MNMLTKKLIIGILVIVITLSFAQVPTGTAVETHSSDEVLLFLREVVSLDTNKYDVTLNGEISNCPLTLGGLTQITGKYTLISQENKIEVLYKFINNTLTYCLMDVLYGSPQYVQCEFKTTRDIAESIIGKYQIHTGDPSLEDYKNLLDQLDIAKNGSKTTNNLKLTSTNSLISSLDWRNSFNGADYTGISISFRNGSFYAFKDDRSYYKIGVTEVNVSQEEAITLALQYVENFSWKIDDLEVKDFNIVEDHIKAQLLTKSKEPLNLYPYWLITLPLDNIYPGLVTTIQVQIWADTSEIIRCDAIPTGGELPYDKFLETQKLNNPQSSIHIVTVAVAAVIITAIAIAIVATKKKRK